MMIEIRHKQSGDVLRTVQAETKGHKVILWSDAPELINRQSAYRLGASLVCGKPQRRADLVKILTQALTERSWRPNRAVSDILAKEDQSLAQQQVRSFSASCCQFICEH